MISVLLSASPLTLLMASWQETSETTPLLPQLTHETARGRGERGKKKSKTARKDWTPSQNIPKSPLHPGGKKAHTLTVGTPSTSYLTSRHPLETWVTQSSETLTSLLLFLVGK